MRWHGFRSLGGTQKHRRFNQRSTVLNLPRKPACLNRREKCFYMRGYWVGSQSNLMAAVP